MMTSLPENREICLVQRPAGKSSAEDFELRQGRLPALQEGQVLVKVRWLSMDTYLHERALGSAMAPAIPLGQRMPGRGIAEVLEGNLPAGTLICGEFGWQEYAVVDSADSTVIIHDDQIPETQYLSVLGMPGLTAWLALHRVLRPEAGQTLLVSSAAGTVGSVVGQLAGRMGVTTIGITSGADKCAHIQSNGFQKAIDRLAVADWAAALVEAAPAGIDLYFDNVGGRLLEAVTDVLKPAGRIVLCGRSAEYVEPPAHIPSASILYKRLQLNGFLVWDHAADFDVARLDLQQAVREGFCHVPETVHQGLESAPIALRAMLDGHGIGKHLVRLDT